MGSELRVFVRQPVMIALSLLLPAGLVGITAIAERTESPEAWAAIAGRNTAAILCITVYFIALNTITARRHTLALKRLRTTALSDIVGSASIDTATRAIRSPCIWSASVAMIGVLSLPGR